MYITHANRWPHLNKLILIPRKQISPFVSIPRQRCPTTLKRVKRYDSFKYANMFYTMLSFYLAAVWTRTLSLSLSLSFIHTHWCPYQLSDNMGLYYAEISNNNLHRLASSWQFMAVLAEIQKKKFFFFLFFWQGQGRPALKPSLLTGAEPTPWTGNVRLPHVKYAYWLLTTESWPQTWKDRTTSTVKITQRKFHLVEDWHQCPFSVNVFFSLNRSCQILVLVEKWET